VSGKTRLPEEVHVPARKGALVFHNETVFDGFRFLPSGTCVRVHDGRLVHQRS